MICSGEGNLPTIFASGNRGYCDACDSWVLIDDVGTLDVHYDLPITEHVLCPECGIADPAHSIECSQARR